jgi:hypothetical protein
MGRKVRLTLLIAGGLLLMAGLLTGLFLAAHYEPAFYRQAMEIDRATLEKGSDRMLQQTAALGSAVQKKGRWKALFTAEQINGWLAVDLVRNHPSTLPPTLRDPRIAIDHKQVTIACRFQQGAIDSVLSLTIEPSVPEPNVIALRIVRARAGLLPAPLGDVLDRLSQAARDMHARLEWRSSGGDPVALLSLPSVEDGQSVQIESLGLGDGELYVAGTTQQVKRRSH